MQQLEEAARKLDGTLLQSMHELDRRNMLLAASAFTIQEGHAAQVCVYMYNAYMIMNTNTKICTSMQVYIYISPAPQSIKDATIFGKILTLGHLVQPVHTYSSFTRSVLVL